MTEKNVQKDFRAETAGEEKTSALNSYPKAEDFYRQEVPFPSQDELVNRFLDRLNEPDKQEEAPACTQQPDLPETEEPEDELDRELRRSRIIGRMLSVFSVSILAAAVILVLLATVGKNTAAGSRVREYFSRYPFIRNRQGTAEGEVTGSVIYDGSTTIGRAILEKAPLGKNIGTIKDTPSLRFDVERDYGVKDVTKAITFDDAIWYINDGTEVIHYTSELIGLAIEYYSALYERKNNGSQDVLKLITPKSRLLGTVTAIKKDPVVIYTLKELEIGELRRLGDDFYLMVRLTEQTNDGNPQTETVQVMRLETEDHEARVAEIADVI